jgi:hypothetical protein
MKRIEFFSLATFLTILCVGLAGLDGCSDDKLLVIKTKPMWEVSVQTSGPSFRIVGKDGYIENLPSINDFDDFTEAEHFIRENIIGNGFRWALREKTVRFVEHPYVEVKN